jgi:ribose 5-phosphate isomerase B
MIALGSDHAGRDLKKFIIEHLEARGIACRDYGWLGEPAPVDYPIHGLAAAKAVAGGECEKGIVICGTGIGVSLVANKVPGIRCALCSEPYSALMSREHNDANMLALGARVIGAELAKMIVDTWLQGKFQGGKHAPRVEMIKTIETTGSL